MAPTKAHSGSRCKNQVKGAPRKNSKKSGGSPRGVKRPPQLATAAIKNKMVCALCERC